MKTIVTALAIALWATGCGNSNASQTGSSEAKASATGSSAKAPPTFTPGNEPAANKFCKGADGTYQDCAIACDTTHAVDVCKLADDKAPGVCKRIGKDKCDEACKKDDQRLCAALKNWVPATCADAGKQYGKLFGDGFNAKAHVADDKQAAVVSAAQSATTESCTKDAWPAETIECVAAQEDLGSGEDCLFKLSASLHSPLGQGPSQNLTNALTASMKSVADSAKK